MKKYMEPAVAASPIGIDSDKLRNVIEEIVDQKIKDKILNCDI